MTRFRSVSRRDFLRDAAVSAAGFPLLVRAQRARDDTNRLFRHGVASGDPLTDRVILWTRVSPLLTRSAIGPIQVRWRIASDERLTQVVTSGTVGAARDRDFTVKIDVGTLRPGHTYYYAFEAGGERSAIGRTRTLPSSTDRVRLASVSCSNYPAGYFNVYRCLANRDDLDAIVHLGDYIYEFANGVFGDGAALDRVPHQPGEAVTLADYRARYATYRSDADLQAVHEKHPFIVVWDDHESANNAWSGGAETHTVEKGDWRIRQAAAYRAYLEWMPVRESADAGIRLYRGFRFGGLLDLVMLDTRSLRDKQATASDASTLADPARSILGVAQERWLFDRLRDAQRAEIGWRLLGQQVLFAPITPPGTPVLQVDAWDGYPAARGRVLDMLAREKIADVVILTGDIHSSWANDVPRDQIAGYQPSTGAGSLAVELVTPAISSPPLFSIQGVRERAPLLRLAAPHVKYMNGDRRGYVAIDITKQRMTADWYHVPNVTERSAQESRAARFVCERGARTLVAG